MNKSLRHYLDLINEEVDTTDPLNPANAVTTPVADQTNIQATPLPAIKKQWNAGVLGLGSRGPEVTALQKSLSVPETGTFDQATKVAVQALQKKLGITADGAYGPRTKAAHLKAGGQPNTQTTQQSQSGMTATTPDLSKQTPAQAIQTAATLNNAAAQGAGWDAAGGSSGSGGAAFGNANLTRQGANARANQGIQQLKTQDANAPKIAALQKEITDIQASIAKAKASGDTRSAQDYAIQLQGAQSDLARLQPKAESLERLVSLVHYR